ncbi:carboxypeptidase-like regulatory domain-containing protein [Lutimonas halocynthiae]|uniref:TonB-dependent receptor n=1 Tax=Lutimonas halocynthiae TaxID=1446477 RepID=UPI0025B4CDF0|nr:carboxypeptidase-like regulatory domain-containing protein [Lutimonas halocynthiae]MDN3644161.1 carboxypeptidase-like regulatory domain-containing protein [Lutimonas halocynthiae]
MKAKFLIFFLFSLATQLLSGQTATIKGKVLDSINNPIENATVSIGNLGTVTDASGAYEIIIPAGKNITIRYGHVSFNSFSKNFRVNRGKTLYFSPRLYSKTESIDEVIIIDPRAASQGVVPISSETARLIPSANQGIESVLKTLPGVNFNNELSTQYNVRGGSFEENLVYVNGIEIYRPFLVRSGQQEGLSFVNPELTQNVDFSAGGFQAKYGDKLSSVLDITYRKPSRFGASFEASFLGASLMVEGLSKDEKFKALVGARYRNNSLFLNSNDIDANFNPNFTDIQTYLSYDFSEKFSLDFLGSYSVNNYDFTPISRQTNFGTLTNPLSLVVNYQGKEEDRYETAFAALKGNYQFSENLSVSLTASSYNTKEQEYYDILSSYGLGDVDANFGSEDFGGTNFTQSIGSQLDHARNNLKAQISNIRVTADWRKNTNLFEFGAKYQYENIKDRINEWQVVDSSGFSLRPPHLLPRNDQPYTPFTGPIEPYINVNATNDVNIQRISGFAQWSKKSTINEHTVWYNLGVRAQHWQVSGVGLVSDNHTVISPRGQFSIKPNWDSDMLFRVSGGLYYQPPFYRELRDSLGTVHPEVKAQKSVHIVLGHDYSFGMWGRPFKLISEVYFKNLTDVNPFTIDNVKIRYRAKNNAIAYAAGVDLRIHGEFVPGTESWFSIGYLQTEENIDDRGYISRPTDQRLKFALLFQDYVPSVPSLKMYLNLVYNTGVPGGSPSYADPYLYQNRLPAYFRTDIGISYVFIDANNPPKANWQKKFKQLSAGLELFNMFDNQNTISNTWVKNVSSNRYIGIPNYLTGRVLNLKVAMRF